MLDIQHPELDSPAYMHDDPSTDFPFELRSRLAYDGQLLAAVGRIFDDSVLGFYRRRMREHHGIVGKSAAVTVVQRASSDLRGRGLSRQSSNVGYSAK